MAKKKRVGRPNEWTETKLKALGNELIEFCLRPDVYHISEFEVGEKKQTVGWLKTLASRHKEFCPFLEAARHTLGTKIVKQAMEGNGNNFIIGRFVPMYLKDVDEFDEEKKRRDHERELAKEKYKFELSKQDQQVAEDITDRFTETARLVYENEKLKDEIRRLKER